MLRHAQTLQRTAQSIKGVANCSVDTPASDRLNHSTPRLEVHHVALFAC